MCDKSYAGNVNAFSEQVKGRIIAEKGTAESRAHQAIAQAEMAKEHAKYRIDQAGFDAKTRIDEASLNAQDMVDEHNRCLKANMGCQPTCAAGQPGVVIQPAPEALPPHGVHVVPRF